nr:HepT-like ribonuclease domain-containing protein [Rhodopseudomonas sp. B29]
MRSDQSEVALRDIRHHIDLVTKFVEGCDEATFKADLRTVYAITRCLEIISEASRRVAD